MLQDHQVFKSSSQATTNVELIFPKLHFDFYFATGPGGKKNRQKERRLMKGFNLASGASSGSGSDANMQIKFSGKSFEQFCNNDNIKSQDNIRILLHIACQVNEMK